MNWYEDEAGHFEQIYQGYHRFSRKMGVVIYRQRRSVQGNFVGIAAQGGLIIKYRLSAQEIKVIDNNKKK